VNSFDYVIESLVEVCDHTFEQAETCAWIAHFKGKCAVKSGSDEELRPYKAELINRKLTVSIE
jgi:ATP-dependent Clp protease adaptor protein ClpS